MPKKKKTKEKYVRKGIIKQNQNGGLYHQGRKYQLKEKMKVAAEYKKLSEELGKMPPVSMVAEKAGVGWHFANSVIEDVAALGYCADPEYERIEQQKNIIRRACGFLKPEHEIHWFFGADSVD